MYEVISFIIIIALSGVILYLLYLLIIKEESEKPQEIAKLKSEIHIMKLDQRYVKDSLWKTKRNVKRLYREIDPTGNNISYDK